MNITKKAQQLLLKSQKLEIKRQRINKGKRRTKAKRAKFSEADEHDLYPDLDPKVSFVVLQNDD